MRPLKFRAWMLDNGKLVQPCYAEIFKDGSFLAGENGVISTDCILMQFTGLLDKNGKEIYEGDIIEFINNEIGTILFDLGCFYIVSKDKKLRCLLNQWYRQLEVIGNIYENPELLNT